jgi:hypothetical protein
MLQRRYPDRNQVLDACQEEWYSAESTAGLNSSSTGRGTLPCQLWAVPETDKRWTPLYYVIQPQFTTRRAPAAVGVEDFGDGPPLSKHGSSGWERSSDAGTTERFVGNIAFGLGLPRHWGCRSYMLAQCARGYSGNICGVCVKTPDANGTTYGFRAPFVCNECKSTSSVVGFAVVSLHNRRLLVLPTHWLVIDSIRPGIKRVAGAGW